MLTVGERIRPGRRSHERSDVLKSLKSLAAAAAAAVMRAVVQLVVLVAGSTLQACWAVGTCDHMKRAMMTQ